MWDEALVTVIVLSLAALVVAVISCIGEDDG